MNGAHTQSFLDTQQDASQPNYSFSEDFTQGTGAYPELSQFQGLTQVMLLTCEVRHCLQSLSWDSKQHSPSHTQPSWCLVCRTMPLSLLTMRRFRRLP